MATRKKDIKPVKEVKKVKKVEKVVDTRVDVYMPVDMEVSPMVVNINDNIGEYERGETYKVEPGIAKVMSARLGVDVTKK